MYQRLWSWLVYLFGLTMQALWYCDYNDKVTAGSLNKTQYSGKWYFIMMAADSDSSLLKFGAMDSAVFLLTPLKAKGKLLLKGEFRLSETTTCLSRQWTYHISNETQEMILEGRPEQRTEIFVKDGDNYIMLLEIQEEGLETFKRLMLYGRSPTMSLNLRLDFEHRAHCLDLTSILVLKQAQDGESHPVHQATRLPGVVLQHLVRFLEFVFNFQHLVPQENSPQRPSSALDTVALAE